MSDLEKCIKNNEALWDKENAPVCCQSGYPTSDKHVSLGSTGEPYYADVEILTCSKCGRLWLDFFYEFESYSRSSTRYRGLITSEIAQMLQDGAVGSIEVFTALPWYFESQFGRRYRTSGEPSW